MPTLTIETESLALSTDELIAVLAGQERPTYAPGRVNDGRQASFDSVAAWNAVGRID